ncbi:hypothetical protein [Burkholderia sp. CCA53]|uniref:hypothetical protein n=1 Tax=Burkholderia sp. CCA53 TaxID=1776288 RepID=UPI0020C787F8|nr:hypothetical protein [Burkholderia sp. CCA53]
MPAAECGLKLDDRIAAFAGQALDHRVQQQAHALGNEGALEEQHRVLVLLVAVRACTRDRSAAKLGLLELALPHIGMRLCDLAPGFEDHASLLHASGKDGQHQLAVIVQSGIRGACRIAVRFASG